MRAMRCSIAALCLFGTVTGVSAQGLTATPLPPGVSASPATPPVPRASSPASPAVNASSASAPTPSPRAPALLVLSTFAVGNWTAHAFAASGTGTFSFCAGTVPYRNGITVSFVLSNTFQWGIVLYDPGWSLNTGTAYPVGLQIDSSRTGIDSATAISSNEVLIPLAPTVALFKDFMAGEQLKVQAATASYTFNLTNTAELLPNLLKCAETYAGKAPVSANPFAAP